MIWKTTISKFMESTKKTIVFNGGISGKVALGFFIACLFTTAFSFAQNEKIINVVTPNGGFHLDGDVNANTPTAGVGDWFKGPATGPGGFVLYDDGTPVDNNTTRFGSDPSGKSDNIFGNGAKLNHDPSNWSVTTGSAPDKNDLAHAMYHLSYNNTNQWIILGADRYEKNSTNDNQNLTGTSYIDFTLFQKEVIETSTGFTTPGGGNIRTVNDILLSISYSSGGVNATFQLFLWDGNGWAEQPVTSSNAFAESHSQPIAVPSALGSGTLNEYLFVEGGVNLTEVLNNSTGGGENNCFAGVDIKSVLVKTKSSDAPNAVLKDFLSPLNVDFKIGKADISYTSSPACSSDDIAEVTIEGVQGGIFSATVGLEINDKTGEIDVDGSAIGTYTITYDYSSYNCPRSTTTTFTIKPTPDAPTGNATQPFCAIDTPTIADLSVSGSNITWYAAIDSDSPLASTDALENNEDYFATQTVDGCESDTRLEVSVTVNDPDAPTGDATQSFCTIDEPTVADLVAVGTSIKWYASVDSEEVLLSTTALATGTYYASQTVGTCESDTRLEVSVTVNDPDAPTGDATQSFCTIDEPTVADLVAVGTSIKWYASIDSEEVLLSTTALATGTYYASQTVGTCESDTRLEVSVTVNDPDAPTGDATQSFCTIDEPTVADLVAVGTSIKWYASVDSEEVLLSTTALATGTYYASQTVGTCESDTRLEVSVTVNDPDAPTGDATQSFCTIDEPTVADLVAVGTSIKWYASVDSEEVLLSTTALATGTYYASQTVGTCESDTRLEVSVTVNDPDAPTGDATQSFCTIDEPTVADLVAVGTSIKWYASVDSEEVLLSTTALATGTYYASQTVGTCESDTRLEVSVTVNDPDAPTGDATQSFCTIDEPTVADLVAVGTSIKWYASIDSEEVLLSTTALATGTYYASQTVGTCESDTRLEVSVTVNDPDAPTGDATQSFCTIDEPTVADLVAVGTSIKWYASIDSEEVLLSTTALATGTYYASQTVGTCESDTRLEVSVTVNDPDAPTGDATQSFCTIDEPTVADLVAVGTSIKWYASVDSEEVLLSTTALATGTYYASQTVGTCESDTRLEVSVTVNDPDAPTGDATQSFCTIDEPTVADLVAVGTSIKWYASVDSEEVLLSTTALATGTYYASQTVGTCESDTRLEVSVTVNDPDAPTGDATQSFCTIDEPTVADLVAVGTSIKWYASIDSEEVLLSTTALATGTYYASQTVGTCESDTRLEVSVTVNDPDAPTGDATQSFCTIDEPTVADLVAVGTSIKWYASVDSEEVLLSTTALATGTYYASQTVGTCESDTRLEVSVTVNDPDAPTGDATQSFCTIDEPTVADLVAVGTSIKWYASVDSEEVLLSTTALATGTYYASQTVGTCESDTRLEVSVTVNDPDAPTGDATQSFCTIDEPTVADLVAVGTSIKWYASIDSEEVLLSTTALATGTYYASQTVGTCESDTRLEVTVEILPEITVSAIANTVTCNGEADGMITVTNDENSTISIFDSADSDVTNQNGALPAGIYAVIARIDSELTEKTCFKEISVEIKVRDNDSPLISVPEGLEVEICSASELTVDNARFPLDTDGSDDIKDNFATTGYTASDDQTVESITYIDDVNTEGCMPVVTRTFYATDNCGAQSSAKLIITLIDNTPPEFDQELPSAEITVECDDVPEAPVFTATDVCTGDITVDYSETKIDEDGDNCGNTFTIKRVWTATDCSENEVSFTQTINIEDTKAPEFDQEVLPTAEITVECDNIPEAAELTATDTCEGFIDVAFEVTTENSDDCANTYVITRTWTATDCADNVASHTQIINVVDTQAPKFVEELPSAELTVECDNIPEASTLTVTDNCSENVEVVFTEETTGDDDECANVYTITRKWTATDCATNEVSFTQVISVIDTKAPKFNEAIPADMNMECENLPDAPVITANDNCDTNVEVVFEETSDKENDADKEYMVTRTWTAKDCAGNEVTASQKITIQNTGAPSFNENLPGDITVECDAVPEPPVITANDNCVDEIEVIYTEDISGDDDACANEYTITRTWTATDDANNQVSHTQTINVIDSDAPEFNEELPAAELTVECDDVPAAVTLTATDNCSGSIEVAFTEETLGTEDECSNVYTITRTWVAADCAGNEVSFTQIINVIDSDAPEFNEELPAAELTVECDNVPDAMTFTAQDNCSESVKVMFTEEVTGDDDECANVYTITRNWVAADCAGNETSFTQTINVIDSDAPEFNEELPAAELTVECDDVPDAVTLTASDNCSVNVEVSFEELVSDKDSEADNNYTITRSYMATDCAGNKVSFMQVITVEDTTAPVITSCPEAVTVPADMGICSASEVELGMPTATDNCNSEVNIVNDAPEVFPIGETTVNWTVTDNAGNIAKCTQIVNVIDDQDPEVETMENITVDSDPGICGAIVKFGMVGANDNCELESVEITEGYTSGSTFPIGVTTVTWTVTDASGNTATSSFIVTVEDNEAPVIDCSENVRVGNKEGTDYAIVNFNDATATDNCEVTVEQTAGPASGSQFPIGTTTVTFTATDKAGNITDCSFTITVEDKEDPAITCPDNIETPNDPGICGAAVEFAMPEFADNSGEVTIEQIAGPATGEVFPVGTTTVSFRATDAAGNTAECSFNVTVKDDEDPSIETVENITVSNDAGMCSAVVNYTTPEATDNCGIESIEITEGMEPGSEFPSGVTTITYIATDTNGNTATSTFTVTVNDTEAPIIECPENVEITVEIGTTSTIGNYADVVATDNCEVTVEMTAGLASGEEFPLGVTTVTYTATDGAGNTTECNFTVTVVEEDLPAPPSPPSATITAQATCANPTATITVETMEGLTYSIDGENYQESGVFSDLGPDTYEITAMDQYGQVSDVTTITIEEPTPVEIEVAADPNLCIEDSIFDLYELLLGEYDDTGVWVDPNNTGALAEGFIDPSLLDVGTYTFEYQLDGNCSSTTIVTVSINDDCVVLPCGITDIKDSISKAVTPNGDNHNDFFTIDFANECGFVYDLMIFNRWGAKVFDAKNYQNNWDGYSKSAFTSSNQLPAGTYYYVLQIRNSGFEPVKGYIYLGTK